jgi:sterol desaturase/sphingolipid hydroxylase (fatty acid hydroxylase superfamily)
VVFPFIDRICGTYYLPSDKWPKGTGVTDASLPKGFMKQLVFPFTKNPFKNDLAEEEKSKR